LTVTGSTGNFILCLTSVSQLCQIRLSQVNQVLTDFLRRQYTWGGGAQWVARLTRNVEVVGSSPTKGPPCLLEKLYLYWLVLVGSRNRF